jgi:YD repeat-containing protein
VLRTSQVEFDLFGRFEVSSTDVFGFRSFVEKSPSTGQPLWVRTPNGLTTTLEYDDFGRLRKQTGPTGVATTSELIGTAPGSLPTIDDKIDITKGLAVTAVYAVKTQIGSLSPSWILFDIKSRKIREVSDGFTVDASKTRFVFKDSEYDLMGHLIKDSIQYDAKGAPKWTVNEYDELGRGCASTKIDGLRTETLYTGLQTGGARVVVAVDPKHQLTSSARDGENPAVLSCGHPAPAHIYRGHALDQETSSIINMRKLLIESSDALGKITYDYDAGGRIEKMVGPNGAVTRNVYDEFGNKISVSDPDFGAWHYEYDPFGRVVRQIDAKGQVSIMEYDVGDRPTRRAVGDTTTTWIYDTASHGIGRVATVINSNGYKEDFYYDQFGRTAGTTVSIDHEQFFISSKYDLLGHMTGLTYPSSFSVENVYDKKGFFIGVKDQVTGKSYWTAKNIDALGRVTEELFGNGITTTRQFDKTNERLQNITTHTRGGARVVDLSLEYDLIGNLSSRSEVIEHKKEIFSYDELNRLHTFNGGDGPQQTYRYDPAGRIKFKSGVGSYYYADEAGNEAELAQKPFHAVLRTSDGANATDYGYDQNGNLVSWAEGRFEYTSDNRLRLYHINDQLWSRFDYGPNGDRFRQYARNGVDSIETLYIGLFERRVDQTLHEKAQFPYSAIDTVGRYVRNRHYLINSSGVFAVVETDNAFSDLQIPQVGGLSRTERFSKLATHATWYLHADQLGSVLRITDETARIRERFWYDPWGTRKITQVDEPGNGKGQTLGNSWKRGFGGHEHLVTANTSGGG